jgi:transcriptional regulator with XRE-family HTH domain
MLRCHFCVFHETQKVGKLKNRCFGQNVYRLRNSSGLTQEQLAEKADISRRYVQLIEASQYTPTIEVAAKLRAAFSVSWEELMKGL